MLVREGEGRWRDVDGVRVRRRERGRRGRKTRDGAGGKGVVAGRTCALVCASSAFIFSACWRDGWWVAALGSLFMTRFGELIDGPLNIVRFVVDVVSLLRLDLVPRGMGYVDFQRRADRDVNDIGTIQSRQCSHGRCPGRPPICIPTCLAPRHRISSGAVMSWPDVRAGGENRIRACENRNRT